MPALCPFQFHSTIFIRKHITCCLWTETLCRRPSSGTDEIPLDTDWETQPYAKAQKSEVRLKKEAQQEKGMLLPTKQQSVPRQHTPDIPEGEGLPRWLSLLFNQKLFKLSTQACYSPWDRELRVHFPALCSAPHFRTVPGSSRTITAGPQHFICINNFILLLPEGPKTAKSMQTLG